MLNRVLFLVAIFSSILTFRANLLTCTQSVQVLTDDLYMIVNSAFKNEFVPEKTTFYNLLDGIQDVILKCADKNVSLQIYDACVDRLYPVISEIEDLIFSVEAKDYKEIIDNSVHIALNLINGISYCIDI